MLITTKQLGSLYEMSALDVLDNSTYLDESEAILNPIAVPVLENTRLDICTVSYKDIQKVCEDYGCYTNEALNSIAEASNVDIDHIAVAIDESDIILDPSIINEFYQYTIIPESDYSIPSVFIESCLDNYIGSNFDEDYLDIMVEPELFLEKVENFDVDNYEIKNGKYINTKTGKEENKLNSSQKRTINRKFNFHVAGSEGDEYKQGSKLSNNSQTYKPVELPNKKEKEVLPKSPLSNDGRIRGGLKHGTSNYASGSNSLTLDLEKRFGKRKKEQPAIPGMPDGHRPLKPIPGRGRSYTPSWGQPKSHIGTNVDVLAGSIGNIKKKIKSEIDRELDNQDYEHAPSIFAAAGSKDRAKTIGTGEVLRKGIAASAVDTSARLGLGLGQKVAGDKAEKEERKQAKQQEKYENVKDTAEEIDTNNKENNKTTTTNNNNNQQSNASGNTQTSSTSSQSSNTNPKPATSSGSSKRGNSSRGGYSSSTSTTKKPTSNNSPKPGDPQDPGFMAKLKRYVIDKPREFLAKMAAKLRNVYKQWLEKAKQESNAGKASFIKRIAAKILQAVDYIMRKIQGTKE